AIGTGLEVDVSHTALATLGDGHLLGVFDQIKQNHIRIGIEHGGTDGHPQGDIRCAGAVLLASSPIFTGLATMDALIAIIHQCVEIFVGNHVDAGALAAIAAIGAATGDVLFATKAGHAIAAFSGNDLYGDFIDKFHGFSD